MNLLASLAIGPQRSVTDLADANEALADLVARAKGGDRDAYTVLYRRYLNDVYRYALVRLRNREAAEDATQTIFVRALSALPTCRENEAFVGWLFVIARGAVADQFRAGHRQLDHLPDEYARPDGGPSPEDLVIQGETTRFLLAARDRCLSGRERELFDLLLTELNDKQIAMALGRSHGAVRTAHSRLLGKLRKYLSSLPGPATTGNRNA